VCVCGSGPSSLAVFIKGGLRGILSEGNKIKMFSATSSGSL
jgi:hypothetical protein